MTRALAAQASQTYGDVGTDFTKASYYALGELVSGGLGAVLLIVTIAWWPWESVHLTFDVT